MGPIRYFATPVKWLEFDDRILALDQTCRNWSVLNETAAAIAESCGADGATLPEIQAQMHHRFGPVSFEDLESGLKLLEQSNLVSRAPKAGRKRVLAENAPYSVTHAYVELLARCNLRCIHCFMGGAPERTEILSTREVCTLICDLQTAGGKFVTLSGGEPLLHPGFEEIARLVVARGLAGTVISNGTTLRARTLDLIDSLGFNLALSLDGISNHVNKHIRGTSADRIIRVIDRALEQLGPDRVTLSFTPVRANLDEIEPLFDFVEDRNIRRVNISVYEEVGRASEHAMDLALSLQDRRHLMDVLFRKAVKLIGRTEIDLNDTRNILSQFIPNRGQDEIHPLWRSVRITSSGDVFPGPFGAVEQFRLGNIRDTTFSDLIQHPMLEDLNTILGNRVSRTPECSVCPWLQICRGGSVAAAYCATGTINAPDPHCEGYKAIFPRVAMALADRNRELA